MNVQTASQWSEAGIFDLATIAGGLVDPRLPAYCDLPLIAPDHIETGTGRLLAVRTAAEQGAISGKYLVEPGDVIYSKIRPYLKKVHLARFKCLCSADMYPMRPKAGTDPEYLREILLSESFTNFAVATSMRSGIPKVNRSELSEFKLRTPPPEEQRAIGHALASASELIDSIESMIVKKRGMKLGMMQQLLTGRVRLDGFSDAWRPRRLGDLLDYEQPSPYLVESTDYVEGGGVPVLTAGKTFVLGHTTETKGVFTEVPVIIFDDFTTATKYVTFPFKAKSSAMKMLRARAGVNLRFVYELMQLIDFVITDHKRRWIAEFSKLEFAVPDPPEQLAIATVIEDAESELAVLESRLAAAYAIKTGMMQGLLSGRVRLPLEAAS